MKTKGQALLLASFGALLAAPFQPTALSEPCPLFDPPTAFSAGPGARAVGIGDFDNDGKPDLAVANFEQPTASILLGNGDGSFQTAVPYATGSGSVALAVADFNHDGAADLVIANYYSSNLSVLLGNGDGTFQAASNIGGGPDPIWVTVGDVNNDLNTDLLTTSFAGSVVAVLLGQGDGVFASPSTFGGVTYPAPISVGDFNGDSNADLAVVNSQAGFGQPLADGVSVFLGNGDGTFQSAVLYTAGVYPRDVAVGDFNGDLQPDLAIANLDYFSPTGSVSILLGDGAGQFSSPINNDSLGSHPISLVVGDFNDDDLSDLAVANSGTPGVPTPGTVSVLLGSGDGAFSTSLSYPGGISPQTIATGDFNLDGRPDLAVASSGDGSVVVLLGHDCNTPPVAQCKNVVVPAGAHPDCNAAASIDDGSFDLDPGDTITITLTPEGPYPLGETEVTLTATDNHGASSSCSATVTVEDTSSPVITDCPGDVTVETGPGRTTCDQVATWNEPIAASCTLTSFTSTHQPGDTFPVGTTLVTYTATDAAGHVATCSFNVTVVDTTPPTVTCGSAVSAPLWPLSKNLGSVGLFTAVTDNCDGAVSLTVEVFSDEDDLLSSGPNFSPDAKDFNPIAGDPTSFWTPWGLRLRAECQKPGDGRVYLIVVKGTDAGGNVGFSCLTIMVKPDASPKSQTVYAQAAAAKAYCDSHGGSPPSDYFAVGDGPIVGPKQ